MKTIDQVMNEIARELPELYAVELAVERDAMCIHVLDPNDDCVEHVEIGPQEDGIERACAKALEVARRHADMPEGATLQ